MDDLRPLTADESDESKALLRRWLIEVRSRKSSGLPDDQPTAAEFAARTAFFDYIEEIDRRGE